MSLINKMLQDLESRKNAQADTASKKSVYEDLKPIKASHPGAPSNKRLSVILLALVVVGGGAYAWMQWGEQLLPGGPVSTQIRPVAAHKTTPKPSAVAVPAPAVPVAVTPSPTAKESFGNAEPPAANSAAMPATATPMTNAGQASGAVPATKPAPVPASVEMKNTTTAAPPVAPAPAKPGEYWTVVKGDTLYSISSKTGIDLWDLSSWNHLGRHHVIHAGQRLRLTPPESAVARTDAPDQKSDKRNGTGQVKSSAASARKPAAKAGSKAVPATSPVPEAPAENGIMNKKLKPLTADEQAEDEYRQAVNQLQKGRAPEAEKHLKAALKFSAEHAPSRELLAGLELQNGRWHEAQQTLEQGIEKVPAHFPFALLLARIQIDHGADQKALAVMEGSRQAGARSADYMAFLAELYRRAGNHAEAIKAYTEAIKLNPQEGRSWIGMGISLEDAQNWKAAGDAYQRAIETGSLGEYLLKYARQRQAVVKNK